MRIGFVAYDGVTALDLIGPYEVFGTANALGGQDGALYAPMIVAPTVSPIASDTGIVLQPAADFSAPIEFDTIVTPGGPGLREPSINAQVAAWLKERAPQTRRMVSVCTGLYGLAAAKLLDGRRAATHWRWARHAARSFPDVMVDSTMLYVEDPPFYSSAGVTAGIDLALALVEQDHGATLALAVARELVIYFKRPGGQSQYSEPLRFQSSAVNRFSDLAAWLHGHLRDRLTVEELAARVNMSPRHFARKFTAEFGVTPGAYVDGARLELARERLAARGQTVESVALSVGFRSADVFRRAFERRYGIAPGMYRRHFGAGQS
ncbi:MAG TPA: helix-turn-helix domain-containing protein [Sphingomicrobium sp.]|nr:helix-turn-helix domain-containing protein [Sphingomicrobium sp.]